MEGEASEEMVAMLHAQCQQAEAVVKAQKNNHLAYSAWGHCLIQLALTQKTNEEKLDYLSRSREKLEKAIAIDCNTTTPDDKLTYFLLGDNNYITYLFEDDDTTADKFLDAAKKSFRAGLKKDPSKGDCLKVLVNAKQQRKDLQDQYRRLKGKSEDERLVEYAKIVREKVETLAPMADSEQGRKDANLLKTYGQACIELSMVTEQLQDLVEAQRLVEVAVDALRSSTALAPDQEAFSMLAVATNAIGIRELDTGKARALFEEARVVFQSAIQLEKDVNAQRQMLLQLRELYSSYGTWREMHPEQAGEMPDEPVPYYLAALPSETDLLEQQQAEAKRVEEAAKGRRRGTKGTALRKGDTANAEEHKDTPAVPAAEAPVGETPGGGAVAPPGDDTNASGEKKKKKNRNNRRKNKGGAVGGVGGLSNAALAGIATGVCLGVAVGAYFAVRAVRRS